MRRTASRAAPGETLKNPELAESLRRVMRDGRAGFYQGPTAEALIATLNQGKHPAALADLAAYQPQWKRPLCTDYRGLTVLSAPPPLTGFQVLHTLELLEPFDLKSLGLPIALRRGVRSDHVGAPRGSGGGAWECRSELDTPCRRTASRQPTSPPGANRSIGSRAAAKAIESGRCDAVRRRGAAGGLRELRTVRAGACHAGDARIRIPLGRVSTTTVTRNQRNQVRRRTCRWWTRTGTPSR